MEEYGFSACLKRGIRGLFQFRGRDNRPQFWFFFLAVLGLVVFAYFVASISMTMSAMSSVFISESAIDPKYFENMSQVMAQTAILQSVLHILVTLLLASAVVRRLHDRERSGFWYLIWPITAINMGLVAQRQMSWMTENWPKFMQGFVDKAGATPFEYQAKMMSEMPQAGWLSVVLGIALLGLFIQLLLAGTAGPNKYGEEP